MLDYTEQIARALSGDATAAGALYSETVASIYYSSLKITGAAYTAHIVTVRTYLLAFGNLGRLTYPNVFPVWLDRIAVYLSYHAARDRYSGTELSEAKARLIAFLRDFHRMNDTEIAALLAMEEQAVSDCQAMPEAWNPDEFLMGRDAVLGIWHDVCSRTITPLPGETEPATTAAASAPPAPAAKPDAPAPAPRIDVHKSVEYQRKRSRRRLLRVSAAVFLCALIAGTVYAALHAKSAESRRTEREVSRLANTLSLQLSGQVGEIYPLSADTYFVSINLGYGSVEGLVIQYELAENAIRVSSPDGAELTESELAKITGDRYMQVLYNPSGVGSGAAKAGALDAKPGETPLPAEATETPTPTKTPIREDTDEPPFDPEDEHDFSIMLRINCRNVDFARPMTVILDSAILKAIGHAGGLQIVLNDTTHSITLSTDQLQKLCSAYGTVTLRMTARSQRQYDLSFYSETGKKVNELPGSMTFTLPASGPMTYVFAVYDSGTESRGGVYDKENETITFPVARSGVYELLGRETEIRDSASMDDETAEAAYFLASLEFMPPDEQGLFHPDQTMTRNEAAAIIGRMFLATDPALHSGYSDVDLSDPAYEYISYGTASQIFTGLADGTFRGEADITREELLTVCGRTLLYRRDQKAPEAEEPPDFEDWDRVVGYARPYVAALVESGILSPGGALRPKEAATRGEAAVLLYRMYCELYGYNRK